MKVFCYDCLHYNKHYDKDPYTGEVLMPVGCHYEDNIVDTPGEETPIRKHRGGRRLKRSCNDLNENNDCSWYIKCNLRNLLKYAISRMFR